jgi:hypothetical protein
VIELKIGEFDPEHAGKLNFYVSTVGGRSRSGPGTGPRPSHQKPCSTRSTRNTHLVAVSQNPGGSAASSSLRSVL